MWTNYHPIRHSEDDESETVNEKEHGGSHRNRNTIGVPLFVLSLISLWTILLLSGTIYAIRTFHPMSHCLQDDNAMPRHPDCSCGSSHQEATALGCKFDVLSLSWLPDRCRDDELTAEFAHSGFGADGQWELWADRNATILLNEEEVALLAFEGRGGHVYSARGFHVAHCSFYWRKEFRMRAKGLAIEGRYDKERHIQHCHAVFMSDVPKDTGMSRLLVRLGGEHVGPAGSSHHKEDIGQ